MAEMELFRPRSTATPMIYAYEELNPNLKGLLKVGYTTVDVDRRVAQQYPTKRPDGKLPYKIVLRESAMYSDGGNFTDHDVHRVHRPTVSISAKMQTLTLRPHLQQQFQTFSFSLLN
jgi:hypothetical protein